MNRTRPLPRTLFLAIALACALVASMCLTACATQPPKEQDEDFIFVCPILENSYWQDCAQGIEEADRVLGTHTRIIGPQTADHFMEEMPRYMQQAIDEHPSGILVYAGLPEVAALIDRATEAEIPVVTIDADAANTSRISFVGTDLYAMGYACGEAMVEQTEGTANIAYVCTATTMENEAQVYTAFKDATHDYYLRVAIEAESGNDADRAAQQTERILKEYPEVNAFFVTGGDNVAGVARVLKENNKTDHVVIGLEDTETNLAYLREGAIDALFVQNPYQMGYQGVKALKKYVDECSGPKSTIRTSYTKITRDNIDSYHE